MYINSRGRRGTGRVVWWQGGSCHLAIVQVSVRSFEVLGDLGGLVVDERKVMGVENDSPRGGLIWSQVPSDVERRLPVTLSPPRGQSQARLISPYRA